jgi:hypothetical protein
MPDTAEKAEKVNRRPQLGSLVMTRGVNDLMAEDGLFALFVLRCLQRHARGDWGDLPAEDKQSNDDALGTDERILSAYTHKALPKVWIITEADRSATTVLFPEEY